jgi:hypothetical protein
MSIIGLVGFIGSGKGTAGDLLQDLGYVQESFAGAVKDVASVMFGWPRNLLEGDTDESRTFREIADDKWSSVFGRSFTPREALQKIGTEVGRDIFHRDFWLHVLDQKIRADKKYVITDVRFPNEIKWIHDHGGLVIEIQRGENPSWYQNLYGIKESGLRKLYMNDYNVHESEWAWVGQNINYRIENNTTKEGLRLALNAVLTTLIK